MDQPDKKLIEAAELIENSPMQPEIIQQAAVEMLKAFGEDLNRDGLKRTPERMARMYEELLAGYRMDPVALLNDALFHVDYEETVLLRDIEFFSLCEHHLLPFMGKVHVAYIPNGKVIGLSKIPRVVDMFSHRLQVQERMTRQIGEFIEIALQPKGVAVVVEAVHLCAMMRGVRKYDARMTTSCMLGVFRTDLAQRMEFLDHISRSAEPLHF